MISSTLNLKPTTLAGFPVTMEYGGIDVLTTLPAPMIAPRPIVTPSNSVTFAPHQTSSSTITSLFVSPSLFSAASENHCFISTPVVA